MTMDNSIPKSIHPPRRMKLSQEDVIKAGFTKGCPGCADINAGRGAIRGSATHSEECRDKVEGYLRIMQSKRLSGFGERQTEKLAMYGETILENERKEHIAKGNASKHVVVEESNSMDEGDVPIRNLPRASGSQDHGIWEDLEEEMDTQVESGRER